MFCSFEIIIRKNSMAFVGIEFASDCGGGVALVHSTWLTPRKKQAYWPPYKKQNLFDKALKTGEAPEDSWQLYSVKRSFFEIGRHLCRYTST